MICPDLLWCLSELASVQRGTFGATLGECDLLAEILLILEGK